MNKVWIIQKPRDPDNFDLAAIAQLGAIEYMLPAASNAHDQSRITSDLEHMIEVLKASSPSDIFITLGGSPLSQMLFGSAFASSGLRKINYGLFSRGRDGDGRRGATKGSYQIIPMDLSVDDPETEDA